MDGRTIGYWVSTGLFSAALAMSGAANLAGAAPVVEAMAQLGYPAYFATILGAWKVAGAAALLAPGLPRVKEWAYAGFFFALTGAFTSHLAAGHALGDSIAPLVLLSIAGVSYALRPADRALAFDALPSPA